MGGQGGRAVVLLVNSRTTPQAFVAKFKSSCPLPHLLLSCHSAFPQAPRTVAFERLPMPIGSAQFKV